MSGPAGLDVRLPIGGLFAVLGLLLAGYGAVTGRSAAPLLPLNLNLWWGLAMLVFGLGLLLGARLGRRRPGPHHDQARPPVM
jgi:hypothetical protein